MSDNDLSTFPPEIELLLRVARNQIVGVSDTGALFGDQTPDWEVTTKLARQHGMQPVLYRVLDGKNSEVPEAVLAGLREATATTARRNLYMTNELTVVMGQFTGHGIPALTYKGPTLAAIVYDDLALRGFADLDILVPEEDFSEAVTLLRAEEYRVSKSFPAIGETTLRRPDTGLQVDLHFSVIPDEYPFSFPFEQLWARRTRIDLGGGRTVRTFHPSDLLAILAVHGTTHFWTRLEWIASLAALARREPTQTARAVARARRIGCERMLLLGFQLSRELLGLSLSEEVSRSIADDWIVRKSAEIVINKVFRQDVIDSMATRAFHFYRHLAQLLLMPGSGSKLKYGINIGSSRV